MKKFWIALLLLPLVAFMANDAYTQLQVTKAEAKKRIFDGFIRGYISFPAASKNVPMAERAVVVAQMAALAKEYVSSPEFAADYQTWLQQEKDNLPLKDMDEVAAEYDKQQNEMNALSTPKLLQDQINSLNSVLGMITDPNSKKEFENQIADLKKQLAETQKPGYVDPLKQNAQQASQFYTKEMAIDAARQENESTLKHYEDTHMKDHKALVKKRLQEFLALSLSVDFDAATAPNKFGKQVFVNTAYESKSSAWKQCYRAGRAANENAQAYIKQWLTELQ